MGIGNIGHDSTDPTNWKQGEPVKVIAVASMTAHGGTNEDHAINTRIQNAMQLALMDAQSKGITDPVQLRAVQLAARDKVLA